MTAGATSLSLVRDELFSTMEQTEQQLEQFISERDNGSHLQQAVESLQQIRGTLNLIGLAGAELLAQEILQQATDIPVGAGAERNAQLSALSSGMHVLRRYLETVDLHRQEFPELLLPAINELRQTNAQALLPESFFFSARLDVQRPPLAAKPATQSNRVAEARRMRHMYQVGLLGFLRGDNPQASLKLMARAMQRLDQLYASESRGRLCWLAAAALEACLDGQLLPRQSRKLLFARLDRELKQLFASEQYDAPRSLLKELLYLVALADTQGPLVSSVRGAFGLNSLPFTDHLLEDAYKNLAGPGQGVMRSLSSAIRDELASLKDYLDLIERGAAPADGLSNLHAVMGKLSKTLGMVGLSAAGNALQVQVQLVSVWIEGAAIDPAAMLKLADTVLYVEGVVASLEHGKARPSLPKAPPDDEQLFAVNQLREARIVVIDEAHGGIAMAKRAITAYLESAGDKMHLSNIPVVLHAVRGGLLFIDQPRAAALIDDCAEYIRMHMLEAPQIPSEQMLDTLADALTSLEYFLEGGALLRNEDRAYVLDLAAESVSALGIAG
ncbi:ferrous iron transporter B [Pseudomonas sp. N040]|uniref:ferrous iron transporter B n=1 Tax=Pseudomonas sp. N040 TaxID=2785325 RepID=UPI0018A2C267|nr:ferrous iron transporter B [Pseudomonas sp. N040]MBF7730708.1 ferrous iron transporter B [Pseudomonas sp. N040]MBW7014351.1 ferrous iron transporter B [Pseudomonas sp. N040]